LVAAQLHRNASITPAEQAIKIFIGSALHRFKFFNLPLVFALFFKMAA
jgi:hypothetical protein